MGVEIFLGSTVEKTLFVCEIFHSLQGEGLRQGLPSVFIRLSGCPLRCVWCDTPYSFQKGTKYSVEAILQKVRGFNTKEICVTGGEPLAQKNTLFLLKSLCDEGFSVSLETSGALSLKEVDSRVINVMDLKAPDSGEEHKNLWENLNYLKKEKDEIKVVIASLQDFEWAIKKIKEYALLEKAALIFSAAAPILPAQSLAEWVLKENLPIRLQVQLHKILWNDARGK